MKLAFNIILSVLVVTAFVAWVNDIYCSWAFQTKCLYNDPINYLLTNQ